MRLFDQINRREVRVRPIELGVPLPDDHEPISAPILRQIVRQCVRVTADECAAWVAATNAQSDESAWKSWSLGRAGLLRLPFQSMWIEWADTEPAPAELLDLGIRQIPPMAAWVGTYDPPEWAPAGATQMWEGMLFTQFDPGAVIYFPWRHILFVNDEGHSVEMGIAGKPDEQTSERVLGLFATAYLAIGLMNCRNVEITETQTSIRSSRKPKRGTPKPLKPLVHHVITLPGSRRPRNSVEVQAIGGGPTPLHLVRGHFKTYTADAPLLGKHVGTYWWQPAVRGDREHGVIETSYRVVPPVAE
ncbi:hypothetical protein [Nocardia xishanensis]